MDGTLCQGEKVTFHQGEKVQGEKVTFHISMFRYLPAIDCIIAVGARLRSPRHAFMTVGGVGCGKCGMSPFFPLGCHLFSPRIKP